MDIEQSSLEWFRADAGYVWDEGAAGEEGTGGPFLVDAPDTWEQVPSLELEQARTLFVIFAALGPTREAILEFANRYGPLTEGERIAATTLQDQDGNSVLRSRGESLVFWQQEIGRMRRAVQLWRGLEDRDSHVLSKILRWDAEGLALFYTRDDGEQVPFPHFAPHLLARLVRGEVLFPAKLLLLYWVGEELREQPVYLRPFLEHGIDFKSYLAPKNLLAAMWLQLLQAVIGERKFKRCELCGEWADVTGKTSRWSRHPECANRDRVRRSWEKKRSRTGSKVVDG